MRRARAGLVIVMVVALVACGGGETQQVTTGPSSDHSGPGELALDFIGEFRRPALPTPPAPARGGSSAPGGTAAGGAPAGPPAPTTGPDPGEQARQPVNVFAATLSPTLSPAVAGITPRVYVPNSDAGTVSVIDPATLEVVDRFGVGQIPHHVTPSWDLSKLYVNNTGSNTFTVIDPRTAKPTGEIEVEDPYNLYFTPDGTKAVVVAERLRRLDFRDPNTWQLIKSVGIPWPGADHLDFSADGKYLMVSTEFSGKVVKVDTERMEVVGAAEVGSLPVDVKVSPDGSVFFVTNQGRHGVSIVDPNTLTEIGFLATGRGAHGLNYSRDTKTLYVSNRLAGTISLIDVASRTVRGEWKVGGSPDMIQINPEGTQLWVSGRYHGNVVVVDTASGNVIKTIRTGAGAHGLCYFPAPGHHSVGHNGVYR
ncbi:MAG TPA: beta-propeller fold lactonase family protein [Acidimicrobiales bacterium]|nr:beta-propeller fold lactonase family protein [Acidimicrobiales bacterium]